MTLTPTQISIIKDQLTKENISEFIETFIFQYATDVTRTSHLLYLIPKISDVQLKIKHNEVIEHSLATNLLIGVTKKNVDFPTLLYTCKVCFPKGNCENGSPNGKMFFQKFIDAIKESKELDWNWICEIAQCEDWMLKVIRQNIDVNFKR